MSNCVVIGCSNSYYTLQRWLKSDCKKHSGKRHEVCGCGEPFQLLPFPNKKKHPELRLTWLKYIKRQDEHNKVWQPKPYSRVCSKHFIDGTPTPENPNPVLQMGHDFQNTKLNSRKKLYVKPQVPEKSEDIVHDHDYLKTYICDCSFDCHCPGCINKHKEIQLLKEENQCLKNHVSELEARLELEENTNAINSFLRKRLK
ncbi:hypothetical protein SNE40_018690 [Patella caerulea]|uniref:THAP-type domain-containing protein n=1 Tax=Patella caerulea TaxID=87958 RepID=A0AAN8J853_PATCE